MSRCLSKRFSPAGLLVLLLLLINSPTLHAQAVSIASVTGRVTDPSGAIVPNAQVQITAVDTGIVHKAVSDSGGNYSFPSLPIGPYTLEVTAPGFQSYLQSGIILQVNDAVQINVTMKVGQVSQRVEVSANATMVQTQQNMVSQVMDQQRIVDMPLNGRDPTQLITISGAAVNHSDGTNTGNKSFYTSQSIAIAGSAGNTTNYLLDGGDNNDSFTNVNMPFPFPDALAEFSVETSVLPARNGLHPGGLVNAVTKSGSNQWHGSLFEFIRNGNVNAINYFAAAQDSLKRNQFGGTFGGRIIRNKLFFFGGIQETIVRQNPSGSSAFIPTTAALNGDFSALDGAGCQTNSVARVVKDPDNGRPLPNDHINPSRFDPSAVAFTKYLPIASADACGKLSYGVPVIYDARQYVTRVDWTISSKQAVYGRYLQDNYDQPAPWSPTNYLYTTTLGVNQRPQTVVLGHTYTFSPSTLNSFHFTFGRKFVARFPNPNGIDPAKLGVINIWTPPLAQDNLQLAVSSSFTTGGSGYSKWGVNSFQESDDVDLVRGKHQIAFGVNLLRTQNNQNDEYNDSGTFSFNGQFSNDPLLDFLMGRMNNFTQTLQQDYSYRQTLIELYGQDTIRLTPKLVANVGLRWEPTLPPHDYFNRGSVFSVAGFTAGKVSSVFPNAPPGQYFYGDPGVNKSFTSDSWWNFSPRLGFVYDPRGDGRTIIRSGVGLLFDSLGTFLTYRVTGQNAPWGVTVSNTSGPYQFHNPWGSVPGGNPFPLPLFPPASYVFPLSAADTFLPSKWLAPATTTWNLGVQHQFAENWIATITYLGNSTSHLMVGNELNPAVYIPGNCGSSACSTTGNTQARRFLSRINQNAGKYFSTVDFADNGISSNYNGLLASLEHRLANNYTILANYTYSRCNGIVPVTSLGGATIQNPANPRGDYGPCSYDVPHLFNLSVVYFSPAGHGGLMSYLLKDWQIAPLVRYETGFPVNPVSGLDNSLTGVGLDRPNVVPGVPRYIHSGHTSKLYQWVNPALYKQNATGTFGNAGHFSLRTPGYFDVDAAISRTFRVAERYAVLARVDAFNVTNHPNFGGPTPSTGVPLGLNANFSSSNRGRITTAGDPRILQGAIKFTF
ncbi:MAG TPA: carboxypeptidase regulatory-like domain-containing protein [Acidobacteriaceae bacterium]